MPPKSFKPTRERKQRGRKSVQRDGTLLPHETSEVLVDTNTEILIPGENKRKASSPVPAADEPPENKMSAKKRKRFNKYLETKAKKEETNALLAKLAERKVDTSLFASTKNLGASRESKKQRIQRALREEQAGLNLKENEQVLYEHRSMPSEEEMREVQKEMFQKSSNFTILQEERKEPMMEQKKDVEDQEMGEAEEEAALAPVKPSGLGLGLFGQSTVGSGLKRPAPANPLDLPVIKRSKKRAPRMTFVVNQPPAEDSDEGSDEEMSEDGSEESGSEDEDSEGKGFEEWKGFSDTEYEGISSKTGSDSSDGDEDSEDDSDEDSEEGSKEEDDSDEDMDSGSAARIKPGKSERANAFKDWARSQVKAVVDGDDGPTISNIESLKDIKLAPEAIPHRKREEDMTPPPEELRVNAETARKHTKYVLIDRSPEVQEQRAKLPVVTEEQRIMEAIHNNSCVVICGETGSGKTTQVPQFLYEAGYGSPDAEDTPGLIGVTQPRRVAAVSMASRVGEEMGTGGKDKVSYQIRFDGTVGPKTAIKFMTDGVLLRELANDFMLRKYSAVIIDEAHERSVNTDILIGVMSRVLKLREQMAKEDPKRNKPLKLIIMSATLRVSDFVDNKTLFPNPPPLLKVDGRTHPVTIHFSRRTQPNYIEEAYKKICKIHRRLPGGGILVFLSGQNEILEVMRRLKKTFPSGTGSGVPTKSPAPTAPQVKVSAAEAIVEAEDMDLGDVQTLPSDDEHDDYSSGEESDLGEEQGNTDVDSPLYILPLYSLLPTHEQLKVFDPPPPGARICILATNIAETSLTIPGIRYVVDSGRAKERKYDRTTGVQSFAIDWTSKASASQRAGRAGRTGPGHCYRLFSSAVYEADFAQFSEAEILRMPIEGVVLQMKAMSIDTIANFPFPTPPDREALRKAEQLLGYLRALDNDGNLTELGKVMNIFPLSPRFAKVLIVGQQHGCLPYVIAIVAALSVGDVFINENQIAGSGLTAEELQDASIEELEFAKKIRTQYHRAQASFERLDKASDAIKLLSVVCAYEYETDQSGFCRRSFVREKAMQETKKLRQQITKIVIQNCPGVLSKFEAKLPPPTEIQVKAIKQILSAGFLDNLALRADLLPNSPFPATSSARNLAQIPYVTLFPSSTSTTSTDPADHAVYIHRSSVLHSQSSFPEYVIYTSLTRTKMGEGKTYLQPLTTISGQQLARLADGSKLISWGKPLEGKPPKEVAKNDKGERRREVWAVPRVGSQVGRGGVGWGLGPCRKVQVYRGGKWVYE